MTPTTAVLFPGQGAQALGMAVDLVDRYPEARRVFDLGREILGFDVLAVCRDGPEAELASTRVSQPAIFLHSMAALEALGGRLRSAGAPAGAGTGPLCRGLPALATAGLSLGEYSALVFAGSLELADAVRIVGIRGTVMQEACEQSTGAMAAVMGFPADGVEQAVAALAGEGLAVFVANYNSPSQTVISGELAAVDAASERLRAAGAKRVIRLNVAGGFHSRLMAPATRKLEPALRAVAIREPSVPFYSNVTGGEVRDPEAIRDGLLRQVESSVRWTQIVTGLVERGMTRALELGPGKVLQGLLRGLAPKCEVTSLGTCADFERAPATAGA